MMLLPMTAFVACGDDDEETGNGSGEMTEEPYFLCGEGKKVRIAKGNIQYRASTKTWRFAPNQYDAIGEDNINISSTYDGWIDLFGWGTSGWNSGARCYEPWSSSGDWNDYWRWGYDIYTEPDYYNLYDENWVMADWGVYNTFDNDDSKSKKWRTPSRDELVYIKSKSKGFEVGSIMDDNEVEHKGLFMLPTNWVQPKGVPELSWYLGGTRNTYTMAQWKKMEKNGAIFLPITGRRRVLKDSKAVTVDDLEYGEYWTSQRFSHAEGNAAYRAWYFVFGDAEAGTRKGTFDGPDLAKGFAVRLIQDM